VIAFDYITAWRKEVPWVDDAQVEQDLVISRAVVEIFSHPLLADALALREARPYRNCTCAHLRDSPRTSISSKPPHSPPDQ
jgi:hypothetical protein